MAVCAGDRTPSGHCSWATAALLYRAHVSKREWVGAGTVWRQPGLPRLQLGAAPCARDSQQAGAQAQANHSPI